jgi:hypothetical protein
VTSLETQTGAVGQFVTSLCPLRMEENKNNKKTIISNTQHRDRHNTDCFPTSSQNIVDTHSTRLDAADGSEWRADPLRQDCRSFLGTGQGMLKSGDRTQAGASLDCPWLVRLAMEREG